MLKILGRKTSSNVQKVLWCCDEIGLPFEREDTGGEFGRNKTPEYLALNPNGPAPTSTTTDSSPNLRAWCERLCERPAYRKVIMGQ